MPDFKPVLDLQLTSPDEFRIRLGEETRTGTLYYLGIDPRTADHDCSPAEGLRRLLTGWLRLLISERQTPPGPCYLPFDFADETTQWLACEISDDMIHAVFGWAPVEGWAISPSDIDRYARQLPEFTPNEPAFVQSFYLPRLLSDLRRVIAGIAPLTTAEAPSE